MNRPIIQLTGISAAYDRKTVLEQIDLTVYEYDFLGVIGPNGGGKTTLMKVILGLLKPSAGEVCFFQEGKKVPEISPLTRNFLSLCTRWCFPDLTSRNRCSDRSLKNSMNRSAGLSHAWGWKGWKNVL